MRKIVLVLLSFLFLQSSFAQDDKLRELAKIYEPIPRIGIAKGVENSYLTDTITVFCSMVNEKTAKEVSEGIDPSKVTFTSPDILSSILKKNLSTCMDFEKLEGGDYLYMIFRADLSGEIKFVSFIYLYRLNIPIKIIEQIETDVRNQCRLDFDKDVLAFADTKYLSYTHLVYLKEVCF